MENTVTTARSVSFKQTTCLVLALAFAGLSGCSSVAPSSTAKGAGAGAVLGGVGGAVVGNNSSMGSGTGIAAGAALGAITGGIIGMVQDARDRKEQDRLAQERAYGQDLARRRGEEAKAKAAMDEELAVAQGFRISDLELNDAKKKLEDRTEALKRLQSEKQAALARKKDLDDALERTLTTEAEIARLEEELARLKPDAVKADAASTPPASTSSAPATSPAQATAGSTTSPAVRPGL